MSYVFVSSPENEPTAIALSCCDIPTTNNTLTRICRPIIIARPEYVSTTSNSGVLEIPDEFIESIGKILTGEDRLSLSYDGKPYRENTPTPTIVPLSGIISSPETADLRHTIIPQTESCEKTGNTDNECRYDVQYVNISICNCMWIFTCCLRTTPE
jgi:hypothetical protein